MLGAWTGGVEAEETGMITAEEDGMMADVAAMAGEEAAAAADDVTVIVDQSGPDG